MSSTIIIKNSATSGSVPASLIQGEFGINVTDGKLYYGSGSAGTVKEFNTSSFSISSSYTVSASYAVTASYALTYDAIFMKSKTSVNSTNIIKTDESIFNPSRLVVVSSSIFIVETDAYYYVLDDLINSGSIIVNGTLKIGGVLYNSGSITGTGIII